MLRHLHEIKTGRTSSISHEIIGFDNEGHVLNYAEMATAEEICEHASKVVTFIDLAGHRKYLRTTVLGLTGMIIRIIFITFNNLFNLLLKLIMIMIIFSFRIFTSSCNVSCSTTYE